MKTIPSIHAHTALVLQRVAKGQGGRCCEPKCTRAGRYSIQIASHFVRSEGLLARDAALCKPCAEAERARWDELCGQRQVFLTALSHLAEPAPVSTEVTFYLRELGYSSEQVRLARAMTKAGVPVEEIAAVLEGRVEVGVAA